MSRLEEDREAARLAEAYRAAKDAARSAGILTGDARDENIPTELKAALMRWATGITITLGRNRDSGTFKKGEGHGAQGVDPETPEAPAAKIPSGPKAGHGSIPPSSPAFGDSHLDNRSGKMEWYAGPCVECEKPAWVRYDPGDRDDGTHKCLKCWMKGRKK